MSQHEWQHYLAQSYLKGFSPYFTSPDATSKQRMKVWCYDKKKRTIELLNVDKVARVPRWYSKKTGSQTYDNGLEEAFAEFEQHYPVLLKKMRHWIELANRQGSALSIGESFDAEMTNVEKAYLCSYLALHVLRVPKTFGMIREMAKERFAADPALEAAYTAMTGSPEPGNAALHGFLNFSRKMVPKVIALLMNKNLTVTYWTPRQLDVLTGDQPVLRGNRLERVIFPIFHRAWIDFHGQGSAIRLRRLNVEAAVRAVNINICGIAEKQVFGASEKTIAHAADSLKLEYTIKRSE
jgi:hypothetical protein